MDELPEEEFVAFLQVQLDWPKGSAWVRSSSQRVRLASFRGEDVSSENQTFQHFQRRLLDLRSLGVWIWWR